MLQTWRWFGPDDPVSLNNVRQAGAVGIVSALHHMNQGQVWSEGEVAKRRAEIEAGGLVWSVSESIGVGETIKTRTGDYRARIDNYKQSIRNASRAGVTAFCYNFMPSPTGRGPISIGRCRMAERRCASTLSTSPLMTSSSSGGKTLKATMLRTASPRRASAARR